MIKIKISDLLGKYKKTQKWLCEKTGMRPATMSSYYHEKIQLINVKDLNKIIEIFKELDDSIKLSDVIDFIDD